MDIEIPMQCAWIFSLDLTVEYHPLPEGLTVRTTVVNIGDTHCPFGAGAHPYLTVGTRIDCALLRSPGRRWMSTDAQMIPIAVARRGRHGSRLSEAPCAIGPRSSTRRTPSCSAGPMIARGSSCVTPWATMAWRSGWTVRTPIFSCSPAIRSRKRNDARRWASSR